jgi:hypothetical protein
MATTARLPEALKLEADAYADRLGISLNALLAVALRDYLDARRDGGERVRVQVAAEPPVAAVVSSAPPVTARKPPPVGLVPGGSSWRLPKSPRAPCPCGSGEQWRHCHGKVKAGH